MIANTDSCGNHRADITAADQAVTPPVTLCRWDACIEPIGTPPPDELAELASFCPLHRTQLRHSAPWRERFGLSEAVALKCPCGRPTARRGLCWTCYKKLDVTLVEAKVTGPSVRPRGAT